MALLSGLVVYLVLAIAVSCPSNGRDCCETPSGLGDAWLTEQSWHFPREGIALLPWICAAPCTGQHRGVVSAVPAAPELLSPQQDGNAGIHPNLLLWVSASTWASIRPVLTL